MPSHLPLPPDTAPALRSRLPQVLAEYTFEEASDTPYILLPYMFEPGREAVFKLTILSDDRDDDGVADFGFQEIKPEDDWKRTTINDAWSKGGEGNPLGVDFSAGGDLSGGSWARNWQFQLSLDQPTRVFVFLELLEVKTDMRDVEGLQTEPDYPTVGFAVFPGRGNHVLLEAGDKPGDRRGVRTRGRWDSRGERQTCLPQVCVLRRSPWLSLSSDVVVPATLRTPLHERAEARRWRLPGARADPTVRRRRRQDCDHPIHGQAGRRAQVGAHRLL